MTDKACPSASNVALALGVSESVGRIDNAVFLVKGIKRELRLVRESVRRAIADVESPGPEVLSALSRFESELVYYDQVIDRLETSAPQTAPVGEAMKKLLAVPPLHKVTTDERGRILTHEVLR